MTFDARLEGLREAMTLERIDASIVSDEANFAYLTGYITQSFAMRARPLVLVIELNRAVAIVGSAEAERLASEAPHFEVIPYTDPRPTDAESSELDFGETVRQMVTGQLQGREIRRLGLELGLPAVPGLGARYLEPAVRLAGGEVADIAAPLRILRRRKDPAELAALERSARTLAATYERFAEQASPGMTERELAAVLRQAAAQAGAEQLRFALVVAGAGNPVAGPPSDRVWESGELLFVDAGITVGGYWADFCRHYGAAEPSAQQLRAYGELVAASRAGRSAVRVGKSLAHVAATIATELPARDGLSIGRFGHGIGLDLTEPPSINQSDGTPIAEDMTLCVEPVAHFPGVGVLIAEEMVAASAGEAPRLLSPEFPAALPVLSP